MVFTRRIRNQIPLKLALLGAVIAMAAGMPIFAQSINDDLNRGADAFNRGHFSEAARHYRKALATDSRNSVARMGLAKALLQDGKTQEAKTELLRLTQEHPNFGAPYYVLGLIYEQEGNAPFAKEAFANYVRKSPGNIPPDPAVRIKLRQYGVL